MDMRCIEFFAGAGGAALGLAMAGFQSLLAVELNPYAALSFMANFPGVPVSRSRATAKASLSACPVSVLASTTFITNPSPKPQAASSNWA